MLHAHVTTWSIGLLLFFITFTLGKLDKEKAQRAVHMILRIFYILILFTGGYLLFVMWQLNILAVIKGLIGMWLISLMELIIVRGEKGQPTKSLWIQFIIALIAVFIMGYGVL